MSNKHTKLKKKPTIEQFMWAQIMKIKAAVPGMKVTIVARFPMDPDAEIVFSDDDIGGLIKTLQRRERQVARSQWPTPFSQHSNSSRSRRRGYGT